MRASLDEFVGILQVAALVTLLLALLIAFNTTSIANTAPLESNLCPRQDLVARDLQLFCKKPDDREAHLPFASVWS
jgi:hypothetical protein